MKSNSNDRKSTQIQKRGVGMAEPSLNIQRMQISQLLESKGDKRSQQVSPSVEDLEKLHQTLSPLTSFWTKNKLLCSEDQSQDKEKPIHNSITSINELLETASQLFKRSRPPSEERSESQHNFIRQEFLTPQTDQINSPIQKIVTHYTQRNYFQIINPETHPVNPLVNSTKATKKKLEIPISLHQFTANSNIAEKVALPNQSSVLLSKTQQDSKGAEDFTTKNGRRQSALTNTDGQFLQDVIIKQEANLTKIKKELKESQKSSLLLKLELDKETKFRKSIQNNMNDQINKLQQIIEQKEQDFKVLSESYHNQISVMQKEVNDNITALKKIIQQKDLDFQLHSKNQEDQLFKKEKELNDKIRRLQDILQQEQQHKKEKELHLTIKKLHDYINQKEIEFQLQTKINQEELAQKKLEINESTDKLLKIIQEKDQSLELQAKNFQDQLFKKDKELSELKTLQEINKLDQICNKEKELNEKIKQLKENMQQDQIFPKDKDQNFEQINKLYDILKQKEIDLFNQSNSFKEQLKKLEEQQNDEIQSLQKVIQEQNINLELQTKNNQEKLELQQKELNKIIENLNENLQQKNQEILIINEKYQSELNKHENEANIKIQQLQETIKLKDQDFEIQCNNYKDQIELQLRKIQQLSQQVHQDNDPVVNTFNQKLNKYDENLNILFLTEDAIIDSNLSIIKANQLETLNDFSLNNSMPQQQDLQYDDSDLIQKITKQQIENEQLAAILGELRQEVEERDLNEKKMMQKIKSLSEQCEEKDKILKNSDFKMNLNHARLIFTKFIEALANNNQVELTSHLNILFSLLDYDQGQKDQITKSLKNSKSPDSRGRAFLNLFK